MPSASFGFSGTELLEHIRSYIGNQSSGFTTFMTNAIPLAEYRFCKLHDWTFLKKKNLSLTVASGTDTYTLDSTTVGYYLAAGDVNTLFSEQGNRKLVKKDLEYIRGLDPDQNDGNTDTYLKYWCEVGDNEILVWPKLFKDTALKVDGKATPSALLTLTNYPTIPYRYQDSFIEYLKAIALDRENDDRAIAKKQEFGSLLRADIQADMAAQGDAENPRIKSMMELEQQYSATNLDQMYNLWAFYGE